MNERLRQYIDSLFAEAPATKKTVELKEELVQNLTDKYNDLIAEGKSEEAAYNIAVASIGDISGLIESLKDSGNYTQEIHSIEAQKGRTKSAILISISVMLYILSVVPVILTENNDNEVKGIVAMFIMIAAATGIIIFNAMTKPKYRKTDDTVVEDFKEWKSKSSNKRQAYKAISSAIWSIMLVVYFIVSFYTGAWYITWLIFLITGALNSILKGIFDLVG